MNQYGAGITRKHEIQNRFIGYYEKRFIGHCFMKKKIANHSLVILGLIVLVGLFQAWKQDKKPFSFFSGRFTQISTTKPESFKLVRIEIKKEYSYRLYVKDKFHTY